MKKVFNSLAFVAVIAFFATSCSDNASQKRSTKSLPNTISVPVSYQTDTVVNVTEKTVKTAPRYSCSGNKLKQPKLVAVSTKSVPMTISQSGEKVVNVNLKDYIDSTGSIDGIPVGNNESSSSTSGSNSTSNPSLGSGTDLSWLWWPAGILILIALIWLAAWLIKNWPERAQRNNNNSSSQTNFMTTNAANPNKIDQLNTMLATLKGTSGEGKGMVKDTKEGYEVVVGEVKTTPTVTVTNSSNVNIYFGSATLTNSNNNGAEPKKNEPAAASAQ